MKHLQAAFASMRASTYQKFANLDRAERFVIDGVEEDVAAVDLVPMEDLGSRRSGDSLATNLAYALPPFAKWGDADRRAATLLLRVQPTTYHLNSQIGGELQKEAQGEDRIAPILALWRAAGQSDRGFLRFLLLRNTPLRTAGRVNSAGRWVLDAGDAAAEEAVKAVGPAATYFELAELLEAERPRLLTAMAAHLLGSNNRYGDDGGDRVAAAILRVNPASAEVVRNAAAKARHLGDGYRIARELFRHDPEEHTSFYLERVAELLMGEREWLVNEAAKAVAADLGERAIPAFAPWAAAKNWPKQSKRVLDALASIGPATRPLLLQLLDGGGVVRFEDGRDWSDRWVSEVQASAIAHLVAFGGDPDRVRAELAHGFEYGDPSSVASLARTAGSWDADAARPLLLPLLKHKSKPVQLAAARAVGRGSDTAEILAAAKELLSAKKADTRAAATVVLGGIAGSSPEAVAALEEVLDTEEVDDVRDVALRELAALDRQAGRTPSKADVLARIDKAEARGRLDPAALPDWLDATNLPAATWSDGGTLTEREVVYLLHRQSRAKEIVADLEAAPMYALLGDTTELGEAVLLRFLGSKAEAKDRWALALAGLLGDDRVVQPLKKATLEWPTQGRGKMAEYAVQALGLIGTDTALSAVDEAARRFETKQKNVGRAAVEALQTAAEARGVSLDELGDGIVPWLGFEGGPRKIDAGGVPFEVSVGPDLKFRYRNLEKDKVVKSLPKSVDPAIKQELKVAAVTLREVGKAQVRRMKNLMVQQRRWPAEAWETLFLRHPILRPLATRLAWAGYESGKPSPVFRPLLDGTLTDTDDEAVELPTGPIGLAHPLELTEEERAAWGEHLTDYEVTPPFPQLDRPVVAVPEGQEDRRSIETVSGETLGALTFRNRAERLGWVRGSVADGGMVTCYRLPFPAAGVDCLLPLEGFFIGVGFEDEVTLGEAVFARHGSYEVGSYTYDEPLEAKDERVVPIGEVPAIAYSEAVGGLKVIAGKQEETQDG